MLVVSQFQFHHNLSRYCGNRISSYIDFTQEVEVQISRGNLYVNSYASMCPPGWPVGWAYPASAGQVAVKNSKWDATDMFGVDLRIELRTAERFKLYELFELLAQFFIRTRRKCWKKTPPGITYTAFCQPTFVAGNPEKYPCSCFSLILKFIRGLINRVMILSKGYKAQEIIFCNLRCCLYCWLR